MLFRSQNWKLTGWNKKLFPVFGKTNKPHYAFASIILDGDNRKNEHILNNVSVPLVEYVKRKIDLEETNIVLNRCFLHLPFNEQTMFKYQGIHIDNDFEHYVMLYYLNDSDGETIIYDQTKKDLPGNVEKGIFDIQNANLTEHARIPPKRGRIVLFDGSRWHRGSFPKESLRCVMNFNLV